MQLQQFLIENKENILSKWRDLLFGAYHPESLPFFKKQKDRFANPIGFCIKQGLADLYSMLSEDSEKETLSSTVIQFLKLRAVQVDSPADAVSFIFGLKQIVFDQCTKEEFSPTLHEWREFEIRLDNIAITIFNQFMESRERLFQVKINELRSGNYLLSEGMQCPSAMLRKNLAKKTEQEKLNNHS